MEPITVSEGAIFFVELKTKYASYAPAGMVSLVHVRSKSEIC